METRQSPVDAGTATVANSSRMDYPLNPNEAIELWLQRHIGSIRLDAPATIHVTYLLGLSPSVIFDDPISTIRLSLRAFDGLMASTQLELELLLPALVATIEPTPNIQTQVIHWDDLESYTLYEPPTLYVLDRRVLHLPNRWEEYRCPISPPDLGNSQVDLNSYYRSYRCPDAQAYGWHAQRSLYLEAHPLPPSVNG